MFMDHMQAQSGVSGRVPRSHMSGLTIALLLVTALASLPAAESVSGRTPDRSARAARTLQPESVINTGFELVAFATLAGAHAPNVIEPVEGRVVVGAVDSASPPVRFADVTAGLMNLPPPRRA